MGKKRSASSGAWLREHFDDHWVARAQREGYRSRACYKLLEINEKDRLLRPGMTVVDLGSAPGGWSQVAAEKVGERGHVLASDILPMDNIADVDFIQGDFTEDEILNQVLAALPDQKAGLVLSDMAPNMSGIRAVDQPRSIMLVELALDFAAQVLEPGGDFLCKVFHGEGFDDVLRGMRSRFGKVITRKPTASRPRSREVYLLGRDFGG